MDLSRFDTREKAHEGVDVPLVIDGEAAYGDEDGQPITFRLKGLADPEVHKVILQMTKAASRTPEEVIAADLKLARAAVIGWSSSPKIVSPSMTRGTSTPSCAFSRVS